MRRVLSITGVAALVLFSQGAWSEDHHLTTITGTNIDLKEYDHSLAGEINGGLVWGSMSHEEGKSELRMKKQGDMVTGSFGQNAAGEMVGSIERKHEDMIVVTEVKFVGISKADQSLTISFNDQPVTVKVVADSFQHNHFQNPTYTATFNGQTVTYTLKGEACYMYSTHLAFMILGAYFH